VAVDEVDEPEAEDDAFGALDAGVVVVVDEVEVTLAAGAGTVKAGASTLSAAGVALPPQPATVMAMRAAAIGTPKQRRADKPLNI
jgi:hypothetical protein